MLGGFGARKRKLKARELVHYLLGSFAVFVPFFHPAEEWKKRNRFPDPPCRVFP